MDFLNFISSFIAITGNSTAELIILTIIGLIAFLVAFGFVCMIFNALGIYDSDLMSDTCWIARVIVFLGLSFIYIEIVKFIKWLFSFAWWIYLIAGIVPIEIIILLFVIKHRIMKKKFCGIRFYTCVFQHESSRCAFTNRKRLGRSISLGLS